MDTVPKGALTLRDALDLAFSIQRVNVNVDLGRLQRGYAIAVSALESMGDYEIIAHGKSFVTRRAHYLVTRHHNTTGHEEAIYKVNLQKELACSCPDTQERGQINCKHIIGVVLWQTAHDIYNQYVRESV